MKTCVILNNKGQNIGNIELDKEIFNGRVNQDCLYQAILMYQANQRRGTASTKTRGEVSGGGIKPWRQKGTGRARHGSIRSPLWRHGGITFGPHPRNYHYELPYKIKDAALESVLNDRINNNDFMIIDEIKLATLKTKEFASFLSKLKIKDKCLVVIDELNKNIFLAGRNIPEVKIKLYADVNAHDVISNKKVLITKNALDLLTKRLKK